MSDPTLLQQTHANGVHVLTFNRPQARNALDLQTMRHFAATITALSARSDLTVVILTGAGEAAFCSGGDLVELSRYPTEADAQAFIRLMGDALFQLERLPIPVIGAINGYALGGGSEIAMACDLRIVDANVRMGYVQIKNAVTPGWGGGQRLLREVGYARAMEILLRGQIMTADDLMRLHLVNRVVEAGQSLPAALTWADEIAAQPPRVVRAIKTLLQAGLRESYPDALAIERTLFPPLWADEPHLRAVESFLKRQSP